MVFQVFLLTYRIKGEKPPPIRITWGCPVLQWDMRANTLIVEHNRKANKLKRTTTCDKDGKKVRRAYTIIPISLRVVKTSWAQTIKSSRTIMSLYSKNQVPHCRTVTFIDAVVSVLFHFYFSSSHTHTQIHTTKIRNSRPAAHLVVPFGVVLWE